MQAAASPVTERSDKSLRQKCSTCLLPDDQSGRLMSEGTTVALGAFEQTLTKNTALKSLLHSSQYVCI